MSNVNTIFEEIVSRGGPSLYVTNEKLFRTAGLGDSDVEVSAQGEAAMNDLIRLGLIVCSWDIDTEGMEVLHFRPYHPNLWEEIVYRLHLADAEMRLAA